MKKQVLLLLAPAVALLCAVVPATAHERDTFKIGDHYYVFTVGSLNEPFVVDSISGVDLRVSRLPGAPNGAAGKGAPVAGLERTLKVELSAGDKKETLAFEPSDQTSGSYTATFIPTVQTTYGYRIFGTLEGSAVDLAFSCMTGEASESAVDSSQVKISESITRIGKIGAYACPGPRKALGFPEPALTSYELNQSTQNLAGYAQAAGTQAAEAKTLSIAGLALAAVALAAAAWKRKPAGTR